MKTAWTLISWRNQKPADQELNCFHKRVFLKKYIALFRQYMYINKRAYNFEENNKHGFFFQSVHYHWCIFLEFCVDVVSCIIIRDKP